MADATTTTTLNAKERRKLQREQERIKAEADAAATAASSVTSASAIKDEPVKQEGGESAAPTDGAPLNAKERRKLAREAERLQQEAAEANAKAAAAEKKTVVKKVVKAEPVSAATTPADVAAATTAANGEKLNAKQRRLLARKASRPEDEATDAKKKKNTSGEEASKKRKRAAKAGEGEGDANKKVKSIHLTLFVGQLPYNATEAKIRQHFHEAGEIQVRMLTDKRTKKFKGTAFIEVKDSKALGAALSRHHTLLNGRRINVEMTASGGGNKSEQRRTKIDLLRKKQSNVQVEKTKALIQKHIDSREYKLTKEDVDERMIDFLSWFDYETAKLALEEYNRCVSDRVQNRKAFFMGILKRFRETDGVE